MPSTLNSDNGVSSGTSGLKSTGGNDGILTFQSSGTETMRVDASGNLGLGVTPSTWYSGITAIQMSASSLYNFSASGNRQTQLINNAYLNASASFIYQNTDHATRYAQTIGQHQWYTAASGTAGNTITFTQAMTLDASGNLGIGTTSPGVPFEVKKNGVVATGNWYNIAKIFDASGNKGLQLGYDNTSQTTILAASTSSAASNMAFYTYSGSAWAEAARIDSSGNLLVGKTSVGDTNIGCQLTGTGGASMTLSASANATVTNAVYSTGAGAYRFYVGMGGTVYATSTTITAISDQRLKENIQDIDVGLNSIMALKPRKFDWKAGKGKNIKGDRGWIAQEFEQVFPEMIDTWRDPAPEGEEPYKAVNADLLPILVKAIQELNAKVEAQAAEIAALKAKV